ncbi:Prenyl proteinase rce1 [Lasiodiplodia theobromae]|uniref:Prenyl proteinase rce1 n=1 Tax=Lasiodiplodia theobromae TaxID=45133 RepID=UPI0015C2DC4E|nr:Prenyl proteinase rce1 [Lasiodiplodia theobromae]KAF4544506.1 Prenyl proteinase rce1 [Lasiodiplodia theobromae]
MAPVHFLQRLRVGRSEPVATGPAITPGSAALLSVLFTVIYVVPFYLSKTTRPSQTLHRDAPSVIRARIRAVTTSCIICTLITLYILAQSAHDSFLDALHHLGWWPISVVDIVKVLLLLCVLFAGPLFENGIVDGDWRDWVKGTHINETFSSWIGWRNFVAGPTTEELIWRSLMIPLHLSAHVSPTTTVFVTPLYFGIAHVHHFYEFRITHPHTPVVTGIARSLFQFTYTSLFGFFAAFVFVRTASLPAVVVAHAFCNWMGLPRLWGRVRPARSATAEAVPIGPAGVNGEGKRADGSSRAAHYDDHIGWTVAYYTLLVGGALGFWWLLWPLTESENALAGFAV